MKFKFDRNEKMFIIHLSNFESDSFFSLQGENNQISFENGHFYRHEQIAAFQQQLYCVHM